MGDHGPASDGSGEVRPGESPATDSIVGSLRANSGYPPATTVIRAIGNAERRRFDYRHTSTRRKKALAYVGLAAMLPVVAGLAIGAYGLGERVAAGNGDGLLQLVRWYLPLTLALYAFYGANEAGSRLLDFGSRELLLTSVRDRDLVLGLLYADLREATWAIVGPTAVIVAAFAAGTGSIAVAVVGTTAVTVALTASILLGYVVGLVGRLALNSLVASTGSRFLLASAGQLAYVLLFSVGGVLVGSAAGELEGEVTLASIAPDGPPPVQLGYYGDLLFVGTPLLDGLAPIAIANALAVVAAIPALTWAIVAVTPRLWRADPPAPTDPADPSSSETDDRSTLADRRDWPWLRFPSGVVADGIVRRSVRTPRRLAHVLYYVLAGGFLLTVVVADPALLPLVLGGTLVLFGLWVAGGAVCLNPIGEEGSMLEQLVLADYPPASFVRARVLAGTVVGLPFVVAGAAVLSLDVLAPADAVLAGGLWLLLTPASAAVAVGIGTFLPKSEPGRVLDRIEAQPPEKLAMLVHGALTTTLTIGVFLLVAAADPWLRWGGLAAVAVSTLVVADLGYRFAVGGIADYGRPRRPDPVYALELALVVAVLGLLLSTNVADGALAVAPVSGSAAFVLGFLASYVGWAVAGAAYLVASGRSREYLDLRLPSAEDGRYLAVGIAGSLGVYGGLVAAVEFLDAPLVTHVLLEDVAGDPAVALALVVVALLVNGPVEEFVFRNVVQKRLAEATSAGRAIVAAAVIFALVHAPFYVASDPAAVAVTLAPLAVLSVLWGWIYDRTGNLAVPAACHGAYNAVVFGVLYASLA